MIKTIRISKYFEDKLVLDDISVEFEEGKCNLIIGSSGSGKTVLMKAIVGLIEIEQGAIYYGNTNFTNLTRIEKQNIRKKMGMLFQGGALFDSLNIEENVMFPLNMFTRDTYARKKSRVQWCLDRVGLKDIEKLMPSELSGGMKKRVAIARAISVSPVYLLADEPNSGLDPKTAIKIDALIKEITDEFKMTTIINSHDMSSVLDIGDRVTYIQDGKIYWEGTKNDILHTDNTNLNNFVFASSMAKHLKSGI